MRRVILVLIVIIVLVFILSFFIKPLILSLAKNQIRNVFLESAVSIGRCEFRPLSRLTLRDIEIKREPLYDFKIKEIRIDYSALSILKITVLNIRLEDILINMDFSGKSISDFKSCLKLGVRSPFLINSLELSGLNIDLKSKEFNLKAKASLGLSPLKQLINHLDINIDSLAAQNFSLEGARLKAELPQSLKDFFLNLPGGTLIIKDDKFLENLAQSSGQPLDLLVESFKNYHYNTGLMRLSLDKGDLVFDVALEGKTGKRNLNITVHDFNLKKEAR